MVMSLLDDLPRRELRLDSVSYIEHFGSTSVADAPIPIGAVIAIRLFDGQQLFTCVVGKPGATSELTYQSWANRQRLTSLHATAADNWTWVNGKEAVVKRTGKASFLMGRLYVESPSYSLIRMLTLFVPQRFDAQGRKPEDKGFPFPQYACHGGGYPIWLKNNSTGPIGTILVSGLPQAEDHQVSIVPWALKP